MELVVASGPLHLVVAAFPVHHVLAAVALTGWRCSYSGDFREFVGAGATSIGVVAVLTAHVVYTRAAPQLIGGAFRIYGVIPTEGLDEVGVDGACKGFAGIGAFYDLCQCHAADQH